MSGVTVSLSKTSLQENCFVLCRGLQFLLYSLRETVVRVFAFNSIRASARCVCWRAAQRVNDPTFGTTTGLVGMGEICFILKSTSPSPPCFAARNILEICWYSSQLVARVLNKGFGLEWPEGPRRPSPALPRGQGFNVVQTTRG